MGNLGAGKADVQSSIVQATLYSRPFLLGSVLSDVENRSQLPSQCE